jgi:TRAP transporter TAXI family solute receptor
VLDLSTGTKLKMLDLTDSISKMSAKYGNFYFPITIPKSTYNTAADVTVSGVANLLVVPSSFDPAFAQAILATMFDNKADLVNVHAAAKELTLETATVGSPIDFHQGAIDFYKSKGAWKK